MIGLLSTHLAKLGRGACCLSPGWAWAMVVSLVGVAVLVTAPPPAPPPDPYPPHTVAVTCKQGCIVVICRDKKDKTSLPYFGVKLSCVCLMFADRKK